MCVTIRVGGPTRLTMGSTGMNRVLGGSDKKLTRTDICKKLSTQTRGGLD